MCGHISLVSTNYFKEKLKRIPSIFSYKIRIEFKISTVSMEFYHTILLMKITLSIASRKSSYTSNFLNLYAEDKLDKKMNFSFHFS